jgi:hypothetical protein
MAGSGVQRLKLAKRGGGSLSIEHVKQSTKPNHTPAGSDKSGFRAGSDDLIWKSYPETKKATGNESPHRGEHSATR